MSEKNPFTGSFTGTVKGFILLLLFLPISLFSQRTINPENVTIVRDTFGVPHIFGKTDPDVAYGLAWAHAEDDFEDIQHNMLAANGMLGQFLGPEGAAADFAAHFLRVPELVKEKYESDLSPEFRRYVEAYCQGINDYAEAHPKEVLSKKIMPVTPDEVLTGYTLSICLMSGIGGEVENILDDRAGAPTTRSLRGSNGAAMSKSRTTDGKTYFFSNSHQPNTGPLAWYEAHLVSEEGMNVLGGTFPGGMNVFAGCTPNLAWMHTISYGDFVDVFELEMHPKNKLEYKIDDEWHKLEKRSFTMKVKVAGIKIPIRKTVYWSEFGPTLKNKQGFWAIRLGALQTIQGAEQWFQMDHAQNFTEFHQALEIQGLSGFNVIYADKHDTIFFVDAGIMPRRPEGYNWRTAVPGNTGKTLWTETLPIKELPQVLNPDCGWLMNTNHSPFLATEDPDNPPRKNEVYEYSFKLEPNNRSLRLRHHFTAREKLTWEQFQQAKYDLQYPDSMYVYFAQNIETAFSIDPNKYPKAKPGLEVLQKWNKKGTSDNEQAAIFWVALKYIMKKSAKAHTYCVAGDCKEEEFVEAILHAQKYMKRKFGRLEVPFGEVVVLRRGDRVEPAWGMPDMVSAMYGEKWKKGKFEIMGGDTYIQFVRFDENGPEIRSVNNFGASDHPDSPHFDDQMGLFLDQKTKPMTLNRDEIFKNAERVYHPGE